MGTANFTYTTNIASFLNRHEITILTQINREANKNRTTFLCASLVRNPHQIDMTKDLITLIAQVLQLKHKDISGSELFETLMIRFMLCSSNTSLT